MSYFKQNKMFRKINQCDIYVGLWCLYILQDVLYSAGIINQLLQLIMLAWSMIAVFKHLIQPTEESSILKATFILIAMYVIYGTIHIMFDDPIVIQGQHVYLQTALNSLAPIFLFYYFTRNGLLTSDRIRVYLPILIIVCILLYYKKESIVLLKTNKEEITNNASYYFLPLIPFLYFYFKKPILQFIFMGTILLYVFMGMKRGVILIGVISTITLLYANLKKSSRWIKILIMLLTVIIIVGISKYIDYMMDNSAYFNARIEETMDGQTSNRDLIYGTLWHTLLSEPNPFYFYFGRGADSTLKVAGAFAHQDWLETFCNNGLIGVIILFFFFYTFAKNVWKSKQYFPGMMSYSFVTLFLIVFSKSLFSMSIQELDLAETMLIGFFAFELYNSEQNDIYETDDSINDGNC